LTEGFVLPPKIASPSVTAVRSTTRKDDINVDDMKRDIAEMREEAIKRLEALNEKMREVEQDMHAQQEQNKLETLVQEEVVPVVLVVPAQVPVVEDVFTSNPFAVGEAQETERLLGERMLRESSQSIMMSSSESSMIQLLDNSRWRLMLNVGREPGTWMPKTWGVSGERLLMNLEMEFTPTQLYDREEFLSGMAGSKILHVVNNEATVAPTMKEGGKRVRVRDGGWRVAPQDGPIGTSILRFYLELEEESRHQGSDVYCPIGRIYGTCGYFPMAERTKRNAEGTGGLKVALRKQGHDLEAQYEKLQMENEMDKNLVSWEKFQRAKQMMDLRMQASKLNQQMSQAYIQEPDKALLRLSQDQSVGLTREGGVCCKVNKGLAIEYHILGRFETASMSNREHSDYRKLLP
jgi:hypothetical protein